MAAVSPTSIASRRRPLRLRRTLLLALLACCAAGFYWYRVHQPHRMLFQAKRTAQRNPHAAEEQVASAIAQSAVAFPEAELFRAQLLGTLGRGDEALGQFSLIENPEQLPAKQLCDLARAAMSRGETLLAEKAFRAVTQDSAMYPQTLRSLIQLHLQMGKEDLAKTECLELVERDPDDSTAWQILGTIAMTRKDLAFAEQAFRKCLTHSDDTQQSRDTRLDLIQVLIDQGRVSQAREELEILGGSAGTLSGRALIEEAYVLRLEGDPNSGIHVLEPLIARKNEFTTRALYLRGLLHGDVGQDQQAVADLETVVAVQPWNKEAHHKLSVAYSRLGQPAQAAEHRKTAEELTNRSLELLDLTTRLVKDPTDVEVRNRVAALYNQLGQPDQARRLLQGSIAGGREYGQEFQENPLGNRSR